MRAVHVFRIALLAMTFAGTCAALAAPAGAAEYTHPNGSDYAFCRANYERLNTPVTVVVIRFRCNYGGTRHMSNNSSVTIGTVSSTLSIDVPATDSSTSGSGLCASQTNSVDWNDSSRRVEGTICFQHATLLQAVTVPTSVAVRLAYDVSRQTYMEAVGAGSGMPLWPSDWFAGGTPPPVADVPDLETTCFRTLQPELSGRWPVNFTTPEYTGGGFVDSYDWDFGDGNGSTLRQPTHQYVSMPTGGHVATVEVTRTPLAGYAFSDGEEGPRSETCSLLVDYARPSQQDPVGSGESDGCPSGVGWINPLNFLDIIGCAFIPGDMSDATGDLGDEIEDSFVNTVVDIVSVPALFWTAFESRYDEMSGTCEGPSFDIPIAGSDDDVPMQPFSICGGGTLESVSSLVRTCLWVLILVGTVFTVLKAACWAMGWNMPIVNPATYSDDGAVWTQGTFK